MITSVTDIQNYMRCRRRWDYQSSSRRNLTGIGVSAPALELGSLVHAALASWTLDPDGECVETEKFDKPVNVLYFIEHANNRIAAITEAYTKMVGAAPSDEELTPLYESIDLGVNMMNNYFLRWGVPVPKNFEFAIPEQEVVVDIPGTEHYCQSCIDYCNDNNIVPIYTDATVGSVNPNCKECGGTGTVCHKLRSIMDGIIKNDKGIYFILERKTYGKRPNIDSLNNNFQFVGYTWVGNQLGIKPLAGIAYDGMWKRKAAPRGSKFEDLFARTTIRFTQPQIDDWGANLAAIVNEMASNPAIYPNRRWEGCNDCTFDALCDMQSRGEDFEHLIKTRYAQRPDTRPVLVAAEVD